MKVIGRDLFLPPPFLLFNRSCKRFLAIFDVVKMFGPFRSVWCKMALAEVGVSLLWWCHALVLLAPGYWRLFLNLIIFSLWKNNQFQSNFRSKLKLWIFSNFTLWNLRVQLWPWIFQKLVINPLWKNYEI